MTYADLDMLAREDARAATFSESGRAGLRHWPHGSAGSSLADMMEGVARQLGAESIRACKHASSGEQSLLFLLGRCGAQPPIEREMDDLAARLAADACVQKQAKCRHVPGELSAVAIPLPDGLVTVTVLFGPDARGYKDSLFNALPLLIPFFQLWSSQQKALMRECGLTAAVNNCDVATILVDRNCDIVFVNKAAEALIVERDGIDNRGGRLGGTSLTDSLRLQAAIAHLCDRRADGAVITPIMAIRRKQRRPIMLTLIATDGSEATEPDSLAIVYIFDPEQDLSRFIEPACKVYGLSPSETKLACTLANGGSLVEAAANLGVRELTARSYLKQIFLKTETNRQAELVWLMLKSAVRTTNKARSQVF